MHLPALPGRLPSFETTVDGLRLRLEAASKRQGTPIAALEPIVRAISRERGSQKAASFVGWDANHDGMLDFDEFSAACRQQTGDDSLKQAELRLIFDALDADGSGRVRSSITAQLRPASPHTNWRVTIHA